MAAETQYTANTGSNIISTANTNLDGSTGTYYDILTAAGNGTLIKSIHIKAQGTTTQGMVRLFIYDGVSSRLAAEVEIPAVIPSSDNPTFQAYLETNFALKSGDVLRASTQNGETFYVVAEGMDWAYYGASVRPESTNYTANTGLVNMTAANTNRDGTGTVYTAITAGVAASGWLGCSISSITFKAQVSVAAAGMVRIYLQDSGSTFTRLFREIPVPATTKSGTAHSFSAVETFNGNGFMLKAGMKLIVSTEKADSTNVITEGADWKYPA